MKFVFVRSWSDKDEGVVMTIALLLPQDRFGLVRRAAALEAGWTDAMLSAAVRRGELIRVATGVYAIAGVDLDGPEGADRLYRLRSIATVSNARDGGATVLSHQSAAAVHGLPLLKPNRENIHVTSLTRGGGLIRGGRNVHGGHLDEAQLVDVDGIRVTDVVRTAVDVAEAGSFAQALTVFDAALRAGADRASIESELGRRRTKGAREARPAIVVADGRSASVGESWSRAQMIEGGLALPELQVEHAVDGDTFVVDYEWHGRLMAEYDGLHKYGRLLRPGETTARAVIREKRREDRLRRATGLVMVRWVWADLESHRVAAILREWLD